MFLNKVFEQKKTRPCIKTLIFQECVSVKVLVKINLIIQLRKSCSVHMRVFEIVVHRNVDNWI